MVLVVLAPEAAGVPISQTYSQRIQNILPANESLVVEFHWNFDEGAGDTQATDTDYNADDGLGPMNFTVHGTAGFSSGGYLGNKTYTPGTASNWLNVTPSEINRPAASGFVISFAFNTTANNGQIIQLQDGGGNCSTFYAQIGTGILAGTSNKLLIYERNAACAAKTYTSTANMNDGQWHWVLVKLNQTGTTRSEVIWIDGVEVFNTNGGGNFQFIPDTACPCFDPGFGLGADGVGGHPLNVSLDEMWIAHGNFLDQWEAQLYANWTASHAAWTVEHEALPLIYSGSSAEATVHLNRSIAFFNQTATVTAVDVPAGITASCGNGSVTVEGTCELAISADASMPTGTYSLELVTAIGTTEVNATVNFTVQYVPAIAGDQSRYTIWPDFTWRSALFGIQFYDLSKANNPITSWVWDFGDGYGSRHQDPFHSYPCAGTYTVVLRVFDSLGANRTVTKVVTQETSSSLCGVLQRSELGVTAYTPAGPVTVPMALFGAIAFLSALMLAVGLELRDWRGREILTRKQRVALLTVSVLLLLLSAGAFASLIG